jgi:hypothetical protein
MVGSKELEKRNLGLFLNFKSVKCPESGKKKNRKNSRTTGTGRDVPLSPNRQKERDMVFCYQNCSDLLREKNVPVIENFFLKFEAEGRKF